LKIHIRIGFQEPRKMKHMYCYLRDVADDLVATIKTKTPSNYLAQHEQQYANMCRKLMRCQPFKSIARFFFSWTIYKQEHFMQGSKSLDQNRINRLQKIREIYLETIKHISVFPPQLRPAFHE
jgi:hypothetical protein